MTSAKKIEVKEQMKDKQGDDRAASLFKLLETWTSVTEYEAALLLLVEEPKPDNGHVNRLLLELLQKHAPKTVPPPYSNDHTIFHVACKLSMVVAKGEKELIKTLEGFAKSDNKYISLEASDALEWVKSGIRYPLEYEGLKLMYDSRS